MQTPFRTEHTENTEKNRETMKKVYDFSKGEARGRNSTGKMRITIYLDDAILKRFKV